MTSTEILWIENFFSEEYEKSLRVIRYWGPLIVFTIPAIFAIFYFHTLDGKLIGVGIPTIIATISILALAAATATCPQKSG
jgi:branched-subunit amino acid transport protein AzlD